MRGNWSEKARGSEVPELSVKHAEIIATFCNRFEGRENEVGCKPIAYGELQMIADERGISIQEVADAILFELNQCKAQD